MAEAYDAVVIGAGHNGLIAAAYLARAGKRVLVLERRGLAGGACVTEEVWPGYHVSTAAYLCSLLRPEIIRDLELTRYGFEVYRREVPGFAPFPDGRYLFLFAEEKAARAELERFCRETPEDVDAYFQFEADIERVAAVVETWMLAPPPTESERRGAFAAAGIAPLYEPFLLGSVRDLLHSRFRSPQLKAVLATDGLIGTYGGPSTPGTAYVLLHHYLGMALGSRGAWGYVRGGMGRITQALAEVVRAHGGEICLNAPVAEITPPSFPGEAQAVMGKTQGVAATMAKGEGGPEGIGFTVRLEDGEAIRAAAVLSNADPYVTFTRLLKGFSVGGSAEEASWNRLATQGGASCKINLAVSELPRFTCLPDPQGPDRTGPEHLGTVHLCPDMEYLERAFEEASRGYPATEPMIEIYLQTATDSSLTPPGQHILSLFTQYFPYHLAPGLDLDAERERYADRVIEMIGRYAPNVPGAIRHRQVLTPRDLEARFGLTGGHIFHGDLLPPELWETRPASGFRGARTPVPGLYLCGSGAHPGGCIFGAPGYNAARAVIEDSAN